HIVCLCQPLFLLWGAVHVHAQTKDTSDLYRRLEKKAEKHKFTKWVFDAVIVDLHATANRPVSNKLKKVVPFVAYKGKVIRKISVVSLDPFGYSVNDT